MLRTLLLAFAPYIVLAQVAAQPAPVFQPLTGEQRWKRYQSETVRSLGLYLVAAGAAEMSQALHDPPEWRQGLAGYGQRSASMLGMFAVQTTVHEGAAAALHYDPRYPQCACKGLLRRTKHAIVWSFVTRNNEGKLRPHLPGLAAAYGSGMVTMAWYPERFSPFTDGVRVGHQQFGFQIGVNMLREFGPEMKRIFLRKH